MIADNIHVEVHMGVVDNRLSLSTLSRFRMIDPNNRLLPITLWRDSIEDVLNHIKLEFDSMIQSLTHRPDNSSLKSMIRDSLFMPELSTSNSFMIYTGKGIIHEIRLSAFLATICSPNSNRKMMRDYLKKDFPIGKIELESIPFREITLTYDYGLISFYRTNGKRLLSFENKEKGRLSYTLMEGESLHELLSSIETYGEAGEINLKYSLYLHDILDIEVSKMGSESKTKLLARDLGI